MGASEYDEARQENGDDGEEEGEGESASAGDLLTQLTRQGSGGGGGGDGGGGSPGFPPTDKLSALTQLLSANNIGSRQSEGGEKGDAAALSMQLRPLNLPPISSAVVSQLPALKEMHSGGAATVGMGPSSQQLFTRQSNMSNSGYRTGEHEHDTAVAGLRHERGRQEMRQYDKSQSSALALTRSDHARKTRETSHSPQRTSDAAAAAAAAANTGGGDVTGTRTVGLDERDEYARKERFQFSVVDMVANLEANAAEAALKAAADARKKAKEDERAKRPMQLPAKVVVKSVSVIELRRAHSMASNSPYLSAVCGQWATTAEVGVDIVDLFF